MHDIENERNLKQAIEDGYAMAKPKSGDLIIRVSMPNEDCMYGGQLLCLVEEALEKIDPRFKNRNGIKISWKNTSEQ